MIYVLELNSNFFFLEADFHFDAKQTLKFFFFKGKKALFMKANEAFEIRTANTPSRQNFLFKIALILHLL